MNIAAPKPVKVSDLIKALDWSKTPVGPMEAWPQSLKATIKTILGSRYPMILLWGEALIHIYNYAYTNLIGDKHPYALGRSIKETQAESWGTLAAKAGEICSMENVYHDIINAIGDYRADVPFAALYIKDSDGKLILRGAVLKQVNRSCTIFRH